MTISHLPLSLRMETQKLLSLSLVSRNENLSTIEKQPLKKLPHSLSKNKEKGDFIVESFGL
jgi:hypothetical protein